MKQHTYSKLFREKNKINWKLIKWRAIIKIIQIQLRKRQEEGSLGRKIIPSFELNKNSKRERSWALWFEISGLLNYHKLDAETALKVKAFYLYTILPILSIYLQKKFAEKLLFFFLNKKKKKKKNDEEKNFDFVM